MRSSVKRVRRAAIEALEGRCLMSVSGVTVTPDNYTPPTWNGSEMVSAGSLREGMEQTATVSFSTDHDNIDGGLAHVHVAYGDPASGASNTADFDRLATDGPFSIGHVYAEEGSYAMSATITDAAGDGTTYTWTSSSDSNSASVVAADADLVSNGGGFSFDPNSTYSGYVGSFTDTAGIHLSDYTGTIDWGDGGSSAATFQPGDNGVVNVFGTHTYTYQIDPNTGEVARPVANFGEKIDNPVHVDVNDAGGAGVGIDVLGHVHLGPWIDTGNNPVHISIAAGANPTVRNVVEINSVDVQVAAVAPPFTATPKSIISVGGGITAGVTLGPPTALWESVSVGWNPSAPPAVGDRWTITVVDSATGAKGLLVVIFDP